MVGDGRMTDGQTTESCLYYKLIHEAKGSGELKPKCVLTFLQSPFPLILVLQEN